MTAVCTRCGVAKGANEFYADPRYRSGHRPGCIQCAKAASAYSKAINPKRARDSALRWRTENPERYAEAQLAWRKGNRLRLNEYQRKWRIGKSIQRSHNRARLTAVRPEWANRFFIKEIYALAKLRTQLTGIVWEVDHIIPIHGENVCGLHVENNLRVIPRRINRAKKNRVDEEILQRNQ